MNNGSKFNPFLRSLLSDRWLMTESNFEEYRLLFDEFLSNGISLSDEDKACTFPYAVNSNNQEVSLEDAEDGYIAVLPVKGAIIRETYCGSPGTQQMMQWVKDFQNDPNCKGLLVDVFSPGGQASGLFEFCEAIKFIFSKPSVSYVNGLAASAGLAIAVSSDYVMASHALAEVGSIGVMIEILNNSKALEEKGYKRFVYRASKSVKKNENYYKAQEGDGEELIKESLDPYCDGFIKHVQICRPDADISKIDNGDMFMAQDSYGLVDEIGTFEDAVSKCRSLIQSNNQSISNKTNMNLKVKSGFASLVSFLGFSAKEGMEECEEEFTAEHLEQVNAELEGNASTIATLTSEKENLETSLATSTKSASDKDAEIAALNEKLEGFKGMVPKTGKATKEGGDTGIEEDDELEAAMADHNQMLKENGLD